MLASDFMLLSMNKDILKEINLDKVDKNLELPHLAKTCVLSVISAFLQVQFLK